MRQPSIISPAINFSDPQPTLLVGFDLVKIRALADSVDRFGDAFKRRLFTQAEVAYAMQGVDLWQERLAARFAAKEATIKALNLANAGVNWRDIEVGKLPDGGCALWLHGMALEAAVQRGVRQWSLSLSHDGDCAGAFVVGLCEA